ncbi:XdhC/CoxI family protein [Streptomyces sp. NPDC050738]|uniref:XdhC family protein n=1 Tax=Streptomyces sp. NPDC050738 TaxID=3154744 RepID=UPI0034208AA9
MKDIAERLSAWRAAGQAFAVASVVRTSGSAPREPGAALAVNAEGEAVGSVSGGCVEGAVYALCEEAIAGGRTVVETFGYSDTDAFAVGLTCGGTLEVLIEPVAADAATPLARAIDLIAAGTPVALARVVGGPAALLGTALAVTDETHHGGLPGFPVHTVLDHTRELLRSGTTDTHTLAPDGSPCPPEAGGALTLFVESYAPAPRMLVFGAIDFAAAVTRIGRFLGYHVTVCDARPVFATARRFPDAHEVVVDWPHRYLESQRYAVDDRTVVCVLTHDAKFDIPLLELALRLPVGYIGAMGSRRTHADREERLRAAGLTAHELARLRSPIGLDLGARTPEETAVAIAAELVAHRRGGGCLPLKDGSGPVHPRRTGRDDALPLNRPRAAA